ncbi:MAG: hypothetical protein LUE14_08695, partial [Clostridiales bacterium]|nr:hypothetical protein [Clostridiales bacterium]
MYSLLACRRGTRPARQLAARLLALLAAVVLCISGSMYTSVDASASNSIATSIGANASSMAACNSALGMLPSWMVSRFQEAGYSVAVTTQDINTVYLDGKYAGQNITGAFSSGKKIIVVANQAKAYSYLVKYATIHEMGHWVDYTTSGSGYTYASDRGDFLKIYNSEYAAYKAAFGMDDVNMAQTKEFFACAFRRYYTDGALLKSRCPGLYAYIEGRIDTLYYMPVFDADYYLARYPDLKIAFGSDMTAAIRHFTRYGMDEGRQAKAAFSVSSYRYKYQDLRLVYGTSLKKYYIHYIEYGRLEGRKATGTSSLQDPVTCLGGVDYSAVYDYAY